MLLGRDSWTRFGGLAPTGRRMGRGVASATLLAVVAVGFPGGEAAPLTDTAAASVVRSAAAPVPAPTAGATRTATRSAARAAAPVTTTTAAEQAAARKAAAKRAAAKRAAAKQAAAKQAAAKQAAASTPPAATTPAVAAAAVEPAAGATDADIPVVSAPSEGSRLDAGAVTVTGRGAAPEGTLLWSVVDAGGTVVRSGHTTGGANGEAADFRFSTTLPAGQWQLRVGPADDSDGEGVRSAALAGTSRSFTTVGTAAADTRAPVTTLAASGPGQGRVLTDSSARFDFSSDEAGSRFQCRLDSGAWTTCTSPRTERNLSPAAHTFAVRAIDAAGNVDPRTVSRTWTVASATPGDVKPTAANTGVPAGTTLRKHVGDLVITTPGARYDALDIYGFVEVKAPNVTITRSRVRGGVATYNRGLVTNTTATATNFVIEDSELVPDKPSYWLDGIKGANYTARRVEIRGGVDGAKVHGDNVRVESSWLHSTAYFASDPNQRGGPTHNDGIQVLGGRNLRFVGNTVTGASNGAMQVTQDYSATTDLVFDRNWADDGTCSVKLAHKKLTSMSGISVRGNRFGRAQTIRNCAVLRTNGTSLVESGNVWDDGSPVKITVYG